MSEPAFSVDAVTAALAAQPGKSAGEGRAIMFASATENDALTSLAAAVALSEASAPWYAIDLNLRRNGMARALSAVEPLGPSIEGALSGVSFFLARDARGVVLPEAASVFAYRRVGRRRAYAGVFDARALPAGAKVAVSPGAEYWDAARLGGANVVIEAPSMDRSPLAQRVARHMDGVVLVVGAEAGAAPRAQAAKRALENAGANIIGLAFAGASAPVMTIERLLR